MINHLLRIIRESIKAVPAMKYALAVAGLLAVVALVGVLKLSVQAAVFGAIVTLVLMVGLVIFARLTTTAPRYFFLPVQVMMWTFLIVTVASAGLLFTATFFQWPRGIRDLFQPQTHTPSAATVIELTEPTDRIAAARGQRMSRDYEGAWNTIAGALAAAPNSTAAREEQLQIAMAWIREMRAPDLSQFPALVRPLSAALHAAAATAKGPLAADIRAHVGMANFLRQRGNDPGGPIEEEYRAAVAIDPTNPFAHAMWGHWLLWQRRSAADAREHFRIALSTPRENQYVWHLWIAALLNARSPETGAELLRVADEVRRKGGTIEEPHRRRLISAVYSQLGRDDEPALLATLPPGDHLTTFRWLTADQDTASSVELKYFHARLLEASGDAAGAARLYKELAVGTSNFAEVARQGLARCQQILNSAAPGR